MSKSKPALPPGLTPIRWERLVKSIAEGNYYSVACASAGCSYRAFRNWMEAGDANPDTELGRFAAEVRAAEANAEAPIVAGVRTNEDWRAQAWWLERRNPDRWGDKVRIELSSALEEVMATIRDTVPDEHYVAILQALESKLPKKGET